jgi:hypothetical protein
MSPVSSSLISPTGPSKKNPVRTRKPPLSSRAKASGSKSSVASEATGDGLGSGGLSGDFDPKRPVWTGSVSRKSQELQLLRRLASPPGHLLTLETRVRLPLGPPRIARTWRAPVGDGVRSGGTLGGLEPRGQVGGHLVRLDSHRVAVHVGLDPSRVVLRGDRDARVA